MSSPFCSCLRLKASFLRLCSKWHNKTKYQFYKGSGRLDCLMGKKVVKINDSKHFALLRFVFLFTTYTHTHTHSHVRKQKLVKVTKGILIDFIGNDFWRLLKGCEGVRGKILNSNLMRLSINHKFHNKKKLKERSFSPFSMSQNCYYVHTFSFFWAFLWF